MQRQLKLYMGTVLASALPRTVLRGMVLRLCERNPKVLLQAMGAHLNLKPNLDNMPLDLPVTEHWQFEHLAGLFASTSLDHAVISMTIRQAAYLFGLVRQMKPRKVIEIGRYKGGSTLVIAAAMNGKGEFWSIDIGEKHGGMHCGEQSRPFDEMLADTCKRFGLKVSLIVGDSRAVDVDTGEVDLVFIDGDHSYEGVRSDFERFGKRVRVGGAVLFDDAFTDGIFNTEKAGIGRLVREILARGEFKLVKAVNRLAHVEKVQPAQ